MAELRSRYPRGCPTGSAVITSAGRLPARCVIHAVGPIWAGGGAGEEALLRSAYRSALALADEAGAQSLTLPAISCGISGYPLDAGSRVAVDEVAGYLAGGPRSVETVKFVVRSTDAFEVFRTALRSSLPH